MNRATEKRFDELTSKWGGVMLSFIKEELLNFMNEELTQAHTQWKAEVRRQVEEAWINTDTEEMDLDEVDFYSDAFLQGIQILKNKILDIPSLQDTEKEPDAS